MKPTNKALLGALVALPLSACTSAATDPTDITDTSEQVTTTITLSYSDEDQDTIYDASTVETITFNGSSITADGANLDVSGSTLTISGAGDYLISGNLNDGQIVIAADKEDVVHLFFDGVNLTNSDGSPFVYLNADKVILTLVEGSTNTLTDGTYSASGSDDPDAALYAKDDLTINGTGTLNVSSESHKGIHGSNDVKILDATVNVVSDKDGIKGKDAVILSHATVTIDAGSDGIQASNDIDQGLGYVAIDGGTITVNAGLDGIQAETQFLMTDGALKVSAGSSATTEDSSKAIRATLDLSIEGGTLDLTSLKDDALHSSGTLTISDGTLALFAGDDGIHADEAVTVNGGDILVSKSYEAIESSLITINDGTLHLNASDDGFNAVTGTSSGGQGGMNMDDGSELIITGGYVYLNAFGDGLDSNGTFTMTGGTVIDFGPTSSNNGSIDYNGSFTLSGGTLLAVGASGMAQQASSSAINTVMVNLTTTLTSGTLVSIVDSDGNLVVAFETIKTANSIVFASETFAEGTYTVLFGGTLNGTLTDHATFSGSVTGGTTLTTFTVSSTITTSGTASGGPGGGGTRPPRK